MTQEKIDFVVTWVDGSDPVWLRKKREHLKEVQGIDYSSSSVDDGENRYREFGMFQYWFRAVEKYAPWVNKVFLVTDRQKPEWLDTSHPKIRWVNHDEFIPQEYLPTYSASTIELNFHRIADLSEKFVYFNDDMYLTGAVSPSDFFKEGLPKYAAVYNTLVPSEPYVKMFYNNMEVLLRHFPSKQAMRKYPFKFLNWRYGGANFKNILLFPWKPTGYINLHIASPMRKSTLSKIWELEYDALNKTSSTPLRDYDYLLNQYLVHYWEIESGQFFPLNLKFGQAIDMNKPKELEKIFQSKSIKTVCVNDADDVLEINKERILEIFERQFPNKSSFEL